MGEDSAMALTDPGIVPGPEILERVLGDSYPVYLQLLDLYGEHGLVHGWRYYRDGKAWLCKVSSKKGTVVWMSARTGFVRATVYVPERLLDGVLACGIGEETIGRIRSAGSVGKSRPCTVDLRDSRDLTELGKLVRHRLTLR